MTTKHAKPDTPNTPDQPPAPLATFRVDNFFIMKSPEIFATTRRGRVDDRQLTLPGFPPPVFAPFDQWVTWGLYSLLNKDHPTDPVVIKPTVLLDVLQFARVVSDSLGGRETYQSDDYQSVKEAMHRLYSFEVRIAGRYRAYVKRSKGKGKRQYITVEYQGRILSSFTYVYAGGKTVALTPKSKRVNVNTVERTTTGERPPTIEVIEGEEPIAFSFTMAADLVRGMTGEGPNIGATIVPLKIFELRPFFGPYPIATRLLIWTAHQTDPHMKRSLDGLARELNLDPSKPARNRETLLKGFELMKTHGVVADFTTFDDEDGRPWVSFDKSPEWTFARQSKGQAAAALPAPGLAGLVAGEVVDVGEIEEAEDAGDRQPKRRRGRKPKKAKKAKGA